MPLGRPLVPLTLTDEQQDQLNGIARSATLPHALVLAARPRFHLHFTPTYASWLNQVERWFGLLSQRAIKRGSFRSLADLVRKIQAFIDSYNASGTPFVWVATAQSIGR